MPSIQSISQTNLTAERIVSKVSGATGRPQSRPGPEIAPEPTANTMLSASGTEDMPGPGLRAHPPEAADNLLGRMPPQNDPKPESKPDEQARTPPDPPGQLAVMLLSMINQTGSSSGSTAETKRTLDIMA